jgi:thymidylate synthase
MASTHFREKTLDDAMRAVIEEIQSNGEWINPSKGECTELTGVLLEIENPRARLSRTETRGKPFSCLGELCWYLAGRNDLEFIEYYIHDYSRYADEGTVFGGYGPRLFNWKGLSQVTNVISLLKRKPYSRQAVIQLFDASDIVKEHKDVPCTCSLQFMIRGGALRMVTNMRSNDVFLGLPHDVFCFTMIHEIVARTLSVELGLYVHTVGSLHLYDSDVGMAQRFLAEGWQSTEMAMPEMPVGDPWPSIQLLLEAENTLRQGRIFDANKLDDLDAYWADLIRLLQVFRYSKENDVHGIEKLNLGMASSTFKPFIDKKLNECRRRSGQQGTTP